MNSPRASGVKNQKKSTKTKKSVVKKSSGSVKGIRNKMCSDELLDSLIIREKIANASIKKNETPATRSPYLRSLLSNHRSGPSDGTISYHGSTRLFPTVEDSVEVCLAQAYDVTADSDASPFQLVIESNPATALGWTEWEDIWKEFRVLSMECEWVPSYQNTKPWGTIGTQGMFSEPISSIVDHTNDTASVTAANMVGYSTFEVHPSNSRFTRLAQMLTIEEATFQETATSATVFSVQFASANVMGASANVVGKVVVYRLVQFRTRKQ